ncbi:MAG TPA: hypothetical protein P5573_08040, partial [Syntrophales bacterium]|nr:hypothetical protein [Syntrophales bacterium]
MRTGRDFNASDRIKENPHSAAFPEWGFLFEDIVVLRAFFSPAGPRALRRSADQVLHDLGHGVREQGH